MCFHWTCIVPVDKKRTEMKRESARARLRFHGRKGRVDGVFALCGKTPENKETS